MENIEKEKERRKKETAKGKKKEFKNNYKKVTSLNNTGYTFENFLIFFFYFPWHFLSLLFKTSIKHMKPLVLCKK